MASGMDVARYATPYFFSSCFALCPPSFCFMDCKSPASSPYFSVVSSTVSISSRNCCFSLFFGGLRSTEYKCVVLDDRYFCLAAAAVVESDGGVCHDDTLFVVTAISNISSVAVCSLINRGVIMVFFFSSCVSIGAVGWDGVVMGLRWGWDDVGMRLGWGDSGEFCNQN